MRKESILAVLAGILIGVFFAFGSWKIIKSIRKPSPSAITKPTPKIKSNQFISFDQLNNFDVIIEKEFVLSGLSNPTSDILIITNEEDFLGKTKTDGEFKIEASLPSGLSQLKILSFNNTGQFVEEKINLVYSTELAKITNESDPKNQRPVAYVGTITDISSETIQIKDYRGEIKQASIGNETSYINTLKKNIEVKSTDLAIGDYVIAMGYVNGNKVLKTKRVLIGSPLAENNYKAIRGKITKITKTKIEISSSQNEINEISLPKKWKGPDIKELNENQTVIVVGSQNVDKFDLRSVFVIE